MKTLRSIESYLRNSPISWLLRFLLLAVFVVVVIGPSAVFMVREVNHSNAGYQAQIRKFSRAQLIEQSWEKTRYANKIAHRAQAMGCKYSPEMYFHDLRAWRDKSKGWYWSGQGPDPNRNMCIANELMADGLRNRRFSEKQLLAAQVKYGFGTRRVSKAEVAKSNAALLAGFMRFLAWALKAYLLGLLFCIITLPLRLADEGRLVDVLIWHRLELAKAIVLWPKRFWEFPHNIPQNTLEIARWRMLVGDPWGRVTEEERLQIEAFANALTLRSWARANSGLLRQRPFWAALAATLILAYLAPFASSRANASPTDDSMVRGDTVVMAVLTHMPRDGTTLNQNSQHGDSSHSGAGATQVAILYSPVNWIIVVNNVFHAARISWKKLLRISELDPVPWLRPVGFIA